MKMDSIRGGSIYRTELLHMLGKDNPTGRILDVGCFDGYFLNHIDAEKKVGVDLNPRKSPHSVDVIQANAQFLPFSDNSFDYIYALDVIEHVVDDTVFANSLLHALAPGGTLILTTPSEDIQLFPPFLTNWISRQWGHYKRNGYSLEQITTLFKRNNTRVHVTQLAAKSFLKWYLFVRIIKIFSTNLSTKLFKLLAKKDYSKNGKKGFILIEVMKEPFNEYDLKQSATI